MLHHIARFISLALFACLRNMQYVRLAFIGMCVVLCVLSSGTILSSDPYPWP